jgi:hypothetical protein
VFSSCLKDLEDDLNDLKANEQVSKWGATIIDTKIYPNNIDTSNLLVDKDGNIYFRTIIDSVAHFNSEDIFTSTKQQVQESVKIDYSTARIQDFSVSYIGSMLGLMQKSTEVASAKIQNFIALNGTNATFSTFSTNLNSINWGTANSISTVTYESGDFEIKLTNNTDFDISNLAIEVRSQSTNLGTYNFTSINAGETAAQLIDMAGKQVFSDFSFKITSLTVNGINQAQLIDLSKSIVLKLKPQENLRISTSVAKYTDPVFSYEYPYTITDNGSNFNEELSLVKWKKGKLNIRIDEFVSKAHQLKISIVGAVDSMNNPVEEIISISGGFNTYNQEFDLTKMTLRLDQYSGQPYNTILLKFEPRFYNTAHAPLNRLENYQVNVKVNDAEFAYFEGDFKSKKVTLDKMTNDWEEEYLNKISGDFSLKSAYIHFRMRNEMGVAASVDLNGKAYNKANVEKNMTFNTPVLMSAAVNTAEDKVSIGKYDGTNSNIPEIISFLPRKFETWGEATAVLEPGQTKSFLEVGSKAYIDMEAFLPLDLRADSLFYQDTVSYEKSDLSDLNDLEEDETLDLKDVIVHLEIENMYPLNIGASIIIHDSINNLNLETIDIPAVIKSAKVNDIGEVQSTTIYKTEITLNKAQRKALINGGKLIPTVHLFTPKNLGANESVAISKDHYVHIVAGAEVVAGVTIE